MKKAIHGTYLFRWNSLSSLLPGVNSLGGEPRAIIQFGEIASHRSKYRKIENRNDKVRDEMKDVFSLK